MRSLTRPTAIALIVMLFGSILAAATPAAASLTIASPGASRRWVPESTDYASQSLADPWDFNQTTDLPLMVGVGHNDKFTNVRIERGRWKGTAQPQANIRLVQSWNSLPIGRDGELHPVDADTYTHLSLRMRLVGTPQAAAELSWFDCGFMSASCKGGMGFWVQEGWHTYDLEIVGQPGRGGAAWDGLIENLILTPSAKAADIEIDWIRLHDPSEKIVRFTSNDDHPNTVLVWDRDRKMGNNEPWNPFWGELGAIGGGSLDWDTSAFEAGTYFVYTVSPNGRSRPRRIRIDKAPRPVVITPTAAGGTSYDTAVRGDAWDFNQASDVGSTRNMTWSLNGGNLVGVNNGALPSDSGFRLALDPNTPIDGDRFHRLTVRVHYEGDFSLSANPGGGMNVRLAWRTTDLTWRVSDDVVVFPGWNTVSIDLTGYSPNRIVEGGGSTGWAGQQIDVIRFDPHEDKAARRFTAAWARLAEDEKPVNGTYRITFRDRAFKSRSTAKVFLSRSADGSNPALIETVSNVTRKTSVAWDVPAAYVGSGDWYVVVEITDKRGAVSTAVSDGKVEL